MNRTTRPQRRFCFQTLTCTGAQTPGEHGPPVPSRSPGFRGGHLCTESRGGGKVSHLFSFHLLREARTRSDTGSSLHQCIYKCSLACTPDFNLLLISCCRPESQTWHQSLIGGPILPLNLFDLEPPGIMHEVHIQRQPRDQGIIISGLSDTTALTVVAYDRHKGAAESNHGQSASKPRALPPSEKPPPSSVVRGKGIPNK